MPVELRYLVQRKIARKLVRNGLVVCVLALTLQPRPGAAHQKSMAARDGSHDFDFAFGVWKTHIARLQRPLTGSTTWAEYEGISVVRKIWHGRAGMGETEADGPAGHLEALSLRIYDPSARQWNLTYASGSGGVLSAPATIGEFKNGRGEFYDMEPINGRNTLVRQVWSDITPNSCHFEQAFSDDAGKTWEVNWIATDTRMNASPAPESK